MTCDMTRDQRGFSLIETMIAMAILATGLLSMAGVFVMGLGHLKNSSSALVAREKAREAVESVHTARDSRVITWCEIYNAGGARNPSCAAAPDPGVFLAGPQPLRRAGPDGLVNTVDDVGYEQMVDPGPDGLLGTDDDTERDLTSFTREIAISEIVTNGNPNPSLRRITVRIRYGSMVSADGGTAQPERVYELTTFISSIS